MLIKMSKKERAREIKAMLVRKGITQWAIARSLNPPVSRSAVCHVIAGKLKTFRIRQAIADALGLRYELVWPRENGGKKAA